MDAKKAGNPCLFLCNQNGTATTRCATCTPGVAEVPEDYLAAGAAAASAEADAEAAFLAFLAFLGFFAGVEASAEADAAGAGVEAACGAAAKAETANREATRAAIILDILNSFNVF